MSTRLRGWIEIKNYLKECGAGFKSGRKTRDHIFVLNSIINNRLNNKKGKLYTTFIDFRSAFNSIDMGIMMEKLEKLGIKGNMYKMIKNIYQKGLNIQVVSKSIKKSNLYMNRRNIISQKLFSTNYVKNTASQNENLCQKSYY